MLPGPRPTFIVCDVCEKRKEFVGIALDETGRERKCCRSCWKTLLAQRGKVQSLLRFAAFVTNPEDVLLSDEAKLLSLWRRSSEDQPRTALDKVLVYTHRGCISLCSYDGRQFDIEGDVLWWMPQPATDSEC